MQTGQLLIQKIFHTLTVHTSYLNIGHVLVEHFHLGIDVVSLLALVQGAVVPHQELKSWVKLSDIIGPSNPGVFWAVGGKAVSTVRVARSHNKHIFWDGLERGEENSTCNGMHNGLEKKSHLHLHQTFCQQ